MDHTEDEFEDEEEEEDGGQQPPSIIFSNTRGIFRMRLAEQKSIADDPSEEAGVSRWRDDTAHQYKYMNHTMVSLKKMINLNKCKPRHPRKLQIMFAQPQGCSALLPSTLNESLRH